VKNPKTNGVKSLAYSIVMYFVRFFCRLSINTVGKGFSKFHTLDPIFCCGWQRKEALDQPTLVSSSPWEASSLKISFEGSSLYLRPPEKKGTV
jgi:hypothetical protein